MAEMTIPNNEVSAKNKYWNEVSLTNQSFIKGMAGHFRHQMNFPEEFIEHFKGKLTGTYCTLQGPTGNEWRVKMTRTQEYTFLSGPGWVNFVKANGIELFDICAFSYYGPSYFKVLIFTRSGSEREVAYFVGHSSSSTKSCSSSLHIHRSIVKDPNFNNGLEVSEDELGDDDDNDDDDDVGGGRHCYGN